MADKALKAKASTAVEDILSNWDCTIERILPEDLKPRSPAVQGNKRLLGDAAPMLPPSDSSKNFVLALREISKLTIGKMPIGHQYLKAAVLERQSDNSHNYQKVAEVMASDIKRAVEMVKEERKDLDELATTFGGAEIEKDSQKGKAVNISSNTRLHCTVGATTAPRYLLEMAKKEAELEDEEVEPRDLVASIEKNWEINMHDCLPRTAIDLRPVIRPNPKEARSNRPLPPLAAYDPNWEDAWRASVPGRDASKDEMKAYMKAQMVIMAGNPEWDIKNPLDWSLMLLHLLSILAKATKGQHEAVQRVLVETVQTRQKTRYAKKTEELQPGDVVCVLNAVFRQVFT
ncbi:uncharacterized protein BDZ99DRAFT_481157 [Mytilinidion resinicola]|uniref:Uncharacterized protein n=1 Tax=Mytilinidion resinicola TaxID=574789 RepID=A0A6A6Y7B0_9PEZI|nr:uncharacterized protein BDZ99DRAFT_481157 [Mytilinidion resinicola]KAF2804702.1 hypothetical protein BDZ99DRAFT_481157 [Mytilinidion resinicola]